MEKLVEKFNQKFFGLEPGESRIIYNSRNDKTVVVGRTNAENMIKDIHETMKEALRKSGIETRD